MAECEAPEGDKADWFFGIAFEHYEVAKSDDFDDGLGDIEAGRGIEIERVCFGVEEPFAGGIKLLEDVLDKAILPVHSHSAVVLPASFISDRSVRFLVRDEVMEVAPHCSVHCVDKASLRVGPACYAFGAEGVGGVAVEDSHIGIEVWVACEMLATTIDE